MKMKRVWAMPSAWTFSIKPIHELLQRYVENGKGWLDPFAGKFSPAEWTNDISPDRNAKYHLDAYDFLKEMAEREGHYRGILFDPPYSLRQISEHYKAVGRKATFRDTSSRWHSRIKSIIAPKIEIGGHAISFGWNTVGFGKKNGFEIIEILIVSHGGNKNDTLCTVEKKIQQSLFAISSQT